MCDGAVLIPIKLDEKVQIKRKYGKYPAKFIYPRKWLFEVKKETKLVELLPRRRLKNETKNFKRFRNRT